MGFGSQSGQVIIGLQSTPGVANANLSTAGTSLKLTSGSLAGNREYMVLDPEIGGTRHTSGGDLGPVNFAGDYEMYIRYRSAALLLYGALGIKDVDPVSGAPVDTAFEHTILANEEAQLPFFTIYEEISNNLERFQYVDAVVNTFHMEADAAGHLTGTAGMLARLVTPGITRITTGADLVDNTPTTTGTGVTLEYDGTVVPAKSFGFDIANNVEDDDFRLGSLFMGDMTAKQREVTASMTLRHDSAAKMRQALFGKASATTMGSEATRENLKINIASPYDIPGAPGVKWGIVIEAPYTVLNPFAFEPSGDDVLENDVEMTIIQEDPAQSIVSVKVTNDLPALV
ncbi:major tail protein [Gordonia phage Camerico]|nr:major tail protein [Gordonia phage Camerico]